MPPFPYVVLDIHVDIISDVSNLTANIQSLRSLIRLEEKRTLLSKQHKYIELRKTYTTIERGRNKNTQRFWDTTFSPKQQKGLEGNSKVEMDRNKTAYRWLTHIMKPKDRILNVGCGDGKFESLFTKEMDAVSYEGMDFATQTIKMVSVRFPKLHFRVGDIVKTVLDKHAYDGILAFEIFEHVFDADILSVQKKIYDALKKNGYLLVAVPLNEPLLDMFPSNPNEHVRLYSKELICAELEISGFTIIKTQEFIAFPKHYALKKFLSRTVLRNYWKANDILVLAKKSI